MEKTSQCLSDFDMQCNTVLICSWDDWSCRQFPHCYCFLCLWLTHLVASQYCCHGNKITSCFSGHGNSANQCCCWGEELTFFWRWILMMHNIFKGHYFSGCRRQHNLVSYISSDKNLQIFVSSVWLYWWYHKSHFPSQNIRLHILFPLSSIVTAKFILCWGCFTGKWAGFFLPLSCESLLCVTIMCVGVGHHAGAAAEQYERSSPYSINVIIGRHESSVSREAEAHARLFFVYRSIEAYKLNSAMFDNLLLSFFNI